VNLLHVAYRGGTPAINDLMSGHVQMIFAPLSEAIQHVKSGKLRALAVTTAARLDVFPKLPTVGDFLAGSEATGFGGLGAPKNIPAALIVASARPDESSSWAARCSEDRRRNSARSSRMPPKSGQR
jgi:tripartite-type tricarboxylate transporter receptor subunit TctC